MSQNLRRLLTAVLAGFMATLCAPAGVHSQSYLWLGGGITVNTHETMRKGVHVSGSMSKSLSGVMSARVDAVVGTANSAVAAERAYYGSAGASLLIEAGGTVRPYGFVGFSLNRHSGWPDVSGLFRSLGTQFGVGVTTTVGPYQVFAEASARSFGNVFGDSSDAKSFAPITMGVVL